MSASQTEEVPFASGATAMSSQSTALTPGRVYCARISPLEESSAKNRAESPLSFWT